MRIDLTDVILDPDLCEMYYIYRYEGVWDKGRFVVDAPIKTKAFGIVVFENAKDLDTVAEADKTKGQVSFFTTSKINVTGDSATSDVLEYLDGFYRIYQVFPWGKYGFNLAIGYRIEGV